MKLYLIDSDVLMDFFKKKEYAINLLDELLNSNVPIVTSILSITELRTGWDEEQTHQFLPELYRMLEIENLTPETAELAGKLRREYKAKGINLSTIDTLIASTAILEKCQLVTRNKKDFPMKEIKFYPIKD